MMISETLAAKIPGRLKPPLRILLGYLRPLLRLLRGDPIKKLRIKLSQQRLLRENYSPNTGKLIVSLTPGYDLVNGGILSISSIYEETTKLKHIHGAEVIMCSMPGHPSLLRYTKFDNQNYIFRFSQVLSYFQDLQNLMIHIPVIGIYLFLRNTSNEDRSRLTNIKNVHINILIQGWSESLIERLAPMEYINELKQFGKLTCTTAHEQYSTPEKREEIGIPLHKLSVWVSPKQYHRKKYSEKENLMIVSPDSHPKKSQVLSLISKRFPQLRIQIIKNLTYEQYKKAIAPAKWALTFGEGLDGYFIETIFSGGVSFSVYNSMFFTEDFKSFRTVYDSYDTMLERICSDINDLDNEITYTNYQKKQYELCCKYYDYKQYISNLESFYKGEYTFA